MMRLWRAPGMRTSELGMRNGRGAVLRILHSALRILLAWLGVAILLPGCAKMEIPEPLPAPAKDYYRPLPPGAPALRKIIDPARLPDFRSAFMDDREGLLVALNHSIRYFNLPSSKKHYPIQGITHADAAQSLIAFRDLLTSAHSGEEFHQRILASFDVYESVGCDDQGAVQFTGYYTPIFDASLTPTAEYRWPLYKLPADLVKDPDGECKGRRLPDGTTAPGYYSRAEIDAGALKGQELVYLKDRFEAYICTVQGSARFRLPGGTWFNVGYHGNNGKNYTSVGLLLVEAGLLPQDQLSLFGLMSFFRRNAEKMGEYLPRNERYVFFEGTDMPPTGSLNLPVTARRTIATDKSIFPRGCLAFVETQIPAASPEGSMSRGPFRQFVLDQDTGGAIRAAGRADIYLGVGDEAGRIAGWTLSEGRLCYLFLKH